MFKLKYIDINLHWRTLDFATLPELNKQVRFLDSEGVRFVAYDPQNRQIIPLTTSLEVWTPVKGD